MGMPRRMWWLTVSGLLVAMMVAWLAWPRSPSKNQTQANAPPPVVKSSGASVPVEPAAAPEVERHRHGEWAPPPLNMPVVSIRYARVTPAQLQAYRDRYAAPGNPDTSAADPSMRGLRQLAGAVASYRSALLYHGSEHVAALYEQQLILLGMQGGGPIGFDTLQERACQLKEVPKDCPVDRFPTCGTYDRLMDVAGTLCRDPTTELPRYLDTDADFGLRERR